MDAEAGKMEKGEELESKAFESMEKDFQEQELPKRKKSLNKMASLSNVSAALSKVGKRCSALQKSISSSRFGSPVGMRAPSTASLARSASNVFGDTTISGRQSPGSQSLQV